MVKDDVRRKKAMGVDLGRSFDFEAGEVVHDVTNEEDVERSRGFLSDELLRFQLDEDPVDVTLKRPRRIDTSEVVPKDGYDSNERA